MTTRDGLSALLKRAMPMQVDAPGPVRTALGQIEDELAQAQQEHAQTKAWVKRHQTFFETYIGTLFTEAAGNGPVERKENAKALLHNDEIYGEYLEKIELLAELDKTFDYLDARRSIGQSILKSFEHDYSQHGQGAQPAARN